MPGPVSGSELGTNTGLHYPQVEVPFMLPPSLSLPLCLSRSPFLSLSTIFLSLTIRCVIIWQESALSRPFCLVLILTVLGSGLLLRVFSPQMKDCPDMKPSKVGGDICLLALHTFQAVSLARSQTRLQTWSLALTLTLGLLSFSL